VAREARLVPIVIHQLREGLLALGDSPESLDALARVAAPAVRG